MQFQEPAIGDARKEAGKIITESLIENDENSGNKPKTKEELKSDAKRLFKEHEKVRTTLSKLNDLIHCR